jgi:hypothetical protein
MLSPLGLVVEKLWRKSDRKMNAISSEQWKRTKILGLQTSVKLGCSG